MNTDRTLHIVFAAADTVDTTDLLAACRRIGVTATRLRWDALLSNPSPRPASLLMAVEPADVDRLHALLPTCAESACATLGILAMGDATWARLDSPLTPTACESVRWPCHDDVLRHVVERLERIARRQTEQEGEWPSASERRDAWPVPFVRCEFAFDLDSGRGSTRDCTIAAGPVATRIEDWFAQWHEVDVQTCRDAFAQARIDAQPLACWLRPRGTEGYEGATLLLASLHTRGASRTRLGGRLLDLPDNASIDAQSRQLRRLLEYALRVGSMISWEWNIVSGGRRAFGAELEILGEAPRDAEAAMMMVHPEDRERGREMMAQAIRSGENFQHQCRLVRRDGRIIWAQVIGMPQRDAAGRVLRFSGLTVDISERKRSEQALSLAQKELHDSLVAACMCLWSYAPTSDRFELWGAVEPMFGASPSTLGDLLALFHPEDATWASRYFADACEGQHPAPREFRLVRPDGDIRWVSVQTSPPPEDAERTTAVRGRLIDISDAKLAELQSQELAERLGIALDAAELSPWSVDLRTRTHTPGPLDTLLFGRSITSRAQFEEQILESDLPMVRRWRDTALQGGGRVAAVEFRIRHTDGGIRWISSRVRCSLDAQGQPEKMIGVSFDISARKHFERQLQDASMRLQQALDAAGMSTLEIPPTEIEAIRHADLPASLGDVHLDDRGPLLRALASELATRGALDHTYRVMEADGSTRWKQALGRLESAAGDAGERIVGVVLDVQQRRTTEAALSESRRWRDLAVEGAGMSVWDVDLISGKRKGSRMDTVLFGFSPVHADEVDALIHPDDVPRAALAWRAAQELDVPYSLEMRIRTPSGSYRWIGVHAQMVTDELSGRAIMSGLTMDIDQRKRAESEQWEALRLARKASEAKSAFLASMSHEIRTPLNAVIGFTGLLEDSPLNAQQTTFMRTLRSSARLLLSLINDILDFSRIEAGEIPIEQSPFSLLECIETSLDFVATQADAKSLALAAVGEGPVTRAVVGDVTRVRQVVVNLLGNAVKFTERGGVVCELSVLDLGTVARMQLRVRDSGIGMDDVTLSRLFQPFQQGDASTTRRFGGTGLGLSICSRLVSLMGGSIDVRSQPGTGSEFTVDLRLPWAAPHDDTPVSIGARRIAVMIASPTVRSAVTAQLRSFGHACDMLDARDESVPVRTLVADALIVDEAHLDRIEQGDGYPRDANDAPLPMIALLGIGQEPSIVHGPQGQSIVRIPRALKPSQLREAIERVTAAQEEGALRPWTIADANATPAAGPTSMPLRILIAEDNAVNQMLLQLQVESLGHRAQVVASGIEAIQAMEIDSFDVILMDIEMPDLDGIDTSRAIRLHPETSRPRPYIVAVTAHATQDMRLRLQSAGMDDFVPKPVLREALVLALERAVAQIQRHRHP